MVLLPSWDTSVSFFHGGLVFFVVTLFARYLTKLVLPQAKNQMSCFQVYTCVGPSMINCQSPHNPQNALCDAKLINSVIVLERQTIDQGHDSKKLHTATHLSGSGTPPPNRTAVKKYRPFVCYGSPVVSNTVQEPHSTPYNSLSAQEQLHVSLWLIEQPLDSGRLSDLLTYCQHSSSNWLVATAAQQ